MVFLRFNFRTEESKTFSLDSLQRVNESEFGITLTFITGDEFQFQIDTDLFHSIVFSDENFIKEYALIELDEPDILELNQNLEELI
jgi:hypothetical protein